MPCDGCCGALHPLRRRPAPAEGTYDTRQPGSAALLMPAPAARRPLPLNKYTTK